MADQTTVYVTKDGNAQVNNFGANGTAPQGKASVGAAQTAITGGEAPTEAEFNALLAVVNLLRTALINCGIGVAS